MDYMTAQLIAEQFPHDTSRAIYGLCKEFANESEIRYLAGANGLFHAAVALGHVDRVKSFLLDRRIDCSSAIRIACNYNHPEILRLLVSPRTKIDISTLQSAIRRNDVEIVRVLLPYSDPTAADNWPIRLATQCGHEEIVLMLLDIPSVDPGACNNWAIRQTSTNGHADIVKLLLARSDVDPGAMRNSAIIGAAWFGNVDVVRLLMADPRVNPRDDSDAALRGAIAKGYQEIVCLF
jgi:ankyrin repeat protein